MTPLGSVCGLSVDNQYIACPETKFHVKTLPHARIPIVKLTLDPSPGLPHGIACDIGFENRLALENTRLLMSYAMIDPTRVRTLVLFREYPRHIRGGIGLLKRVASSQGLEQETVSMFRVGYSF